MFFSVRSTIPPAKLLLFSDMCKKKAKKVLIVPRCMHVVREEDARETQEIRPRFTKMHRHFFSANVFNFPARKIITCKVHFLQKKFGYIKKKC